MSNLIMRNFRLILVSLLVVIGFVLMPIEVDLVDTNNILQVTEVDANEDDGFGQYGDGSRTDGSFRDLPLVDQLVTGDLYEVISQIISWVLSFLGLIVFGLFLFAGFEYATAGADETKTGNATKRMTNAVIGLIIIFLSWILSGTVLNFIDSINGST